MKGRRRWYAIITMIMLASSLLGAGSGMANPTNSGISAPIRLQAGTFNPGLGETLNLPAVLRVADYASNAHGYYIVQFKGPVQYTWKSQVVRLGGELLGYLPENAFKVRMNPAQAARVAALDTVAWVGIFQPAYKLSPKLDLNGLNLVRVRVERGADFGQVRAAIAQSGAQVLTGPGEYLLVGADGGQLQAIANVLDVAWVERYVLPEKHNEYGAGVIVGANSANASGYDGSTQIAAVSDTGLGNGTATGAHPDIPAGRIVSIYNWPGLTNICFQQIFDDGAIDVDSGHGTHTAASVLSDGGAAGEGKGTAPAARLVFQATENWATISNYCQIFGGWPASGYFLTGLPDDLRQMYQQAYNAGARIHSNSWGAALAGDYTVDSANSDDFIWNNPDMTITFSAGNEGTDANANGVVDNDSIGSPATAKNVITVGASEGDRQGNYPCDTNLTYGSHDAYQTGQTCNSMGGNQSGFLGTWGQRYPADFPAAPLAGDLTAGNQNQMASWSSRGPTDDGRIKPDVVAPGTWILSGFSGLYQEGYGDPVNPRNGLYQWDGWGMPRNEFYKYMGGTSMSNPIAAGAATVVRDYYQKAHSHAASAALVKATLINSAVDLLDENNDGANDNDFAIPNVHEGWGRVNLANATDGNHQYTDNTARLNTGGTFTQQFNLATAGQPFKVTLVWSDYPSTEAASTNLVNNLNLVVTAPGGTQYRGNVFSGGWSQTGGSADTVNNVENVYVQSAAAGNWSVQVSGFNVPNGPQPFALVVDGSFGAVDNPPSVTITNPAEGATVAGSIIISANASDDNGVTQVEFFIDNVSLGIDTSAPYSLSWDTTTVPDGGHIVTATATDTIGQTFSDSNNVTVENIVDTTLHVGDIDGASVNSGKNWQAQVTVTVHNASENPVANATVSGSWSGDTSGSGNCTTGGSGTCSILSSSMPKKGTNSATFTVSSISHSSLTYYAADNHDNDGDSSGTAIQVNKDGSTSNPGNQPPTASFTYSCTSLACNFDGSASSDADGSIASYNWIFGDGGTGIGATTSHTYTTDGFYTVVLTVTDNGGASDTDTQSVPVGNVPPISLSVTAYKVKGVQHADLTWSGANSTNVNIKRDGVIIITTTNDGAYTDNLGAKGSGSVTYQVCEAGTNTCSNQAVATW